MSKPAIYRFRLFKGRASHWYFRLIAPDGEIVAASEAYTRKRDVKRAVKDILAANLKLED